MPTMKRSIASYWNGSAWVDIVIPSTTNSAVINLDIEDVVSVPTMAFLRISNRSSDPTDVASNQLNGALDDSQRDVDVDSGPAFVVGEIIRVDDEDMLIDSIDSNELTVTRGHRNSTAATHDDNAPVYGSATAKGPYTDVLTDFVPIKVRDGDSGAILFYGTVYSTKEVYDTSYGMVIEAQCRDYLTELRDNSTSGAYGYNITDSTGTAISNFVVNSNVPDREKNLWQTLVSSRSGLIKSLITQFSNNITTASATNRFIESDNRFGDVGTYKLGGRNQKSVLAHIIELANSEPYTVSGEEVFGYDFYLDPNFTLTTAAHKPTAAFNYFKRGQRPNTDSDPLNYGLRIEYPSTANFTSTGKLLPMLDFDFERPRAEIFTDAMVSYSAVSETEDGGTSVESRTIPFEIIQIKAASSSLSATVPRWKGKPIASGHTAYGENDAGTSTIFPEWLEVEIDSSWVTVARMQYINRVDYSNFSETSPAYVLISDVNPAVSDIAAHFDEDTVWRGKDTTALTFTLLNRPRTKYGVRRSLNIDMASGDKPAAIREQIASALIQRSTQIVRGSFKTYDKPQYYFDDSPASLTGTTTQVLNLSGSTNPLTNGFRVGMAVVELDANGDATSTYGYASAVDATTVTVTWATGTTSTSNTLRYYVPVRAGDLVYLRNNLINVAGNYLVTKIKYSEQPGVSSTHYEVVGRETNKEGGSNRKSFAVATAEKANTHPNIPQGKPNAAKNSESVAGIEFTSSLTNQVAWGTGTYSSNAYPSNGTLTIGINRYTINLGNTSSTMVSAANGNTGQATDGTSGDLATDIDYYIYYSGSGTALSTIRKAAYKNVADEYTLLIGHCKKDTVEAEFSLFIQNSSIPDKGSATKKLSKNSITADLIVANTITTTQLNFTPNTDSTASIQAVAAATSGSIGSDSTPVTLAGLKVAASTFFMGTGTFAHSNTPFFVRGVDGSGGTAGDFSLGDKFSWDNSASTLNIVGDITGASSIELNNSDDLIGGSGERLIINTSDGTSRLRIRAFSNRDYGINHILGTSGWMLSFQGSVADAGTMYGVYPQNQYLKAHIGYIYDGYDEALWGTEDAPTTGKVNGWGGLILAGALSDSAADTRYLHLLHGGTANYKITFPAALPADNKILKVVSYSGGNATLEWADETDTNTVYTHPTHAGDDISIDTTALTGATVISDLDFNVTTDGTGHVTDATLTTLATRDLTAANIGAAWTIAGVSGDTEAISNQTLNFHGSGGISSAYSASSNTLTISYSSSQRYKENIENLTLDTSKIYNLVPRTFTWKANSPTNLDNQSDFGLIAEEVKEIIPELVFDNQDGEVEGVRYLTLSVLLLAELKKLKARIEALEAG